MENGVRETLWHHKCEREQDLRILTYITCEVNLRAYEYLNGVKHTGSRKGHFWRALGLKTMKENRERRRRERRKFGEFARSYVKKHAKSALKWSIHCHLHHTP